MFGCYWNVITDTKIYIQQKRNLAEMGEDIYSKSGELLKRLENASKFSAKYNIYPYDEALRIMHEMRDLSSHIPDTASPKTEEEVIRAELKRRLNGEASSLEQSLSSKCYDFNTIISILGIPKQDIAELRPWLLKNKESTIEATRRLYHTKEIKNYELHLRYDIPSVRRQAEEFAAVHVQKYHKLLGEFLQKMTKVGEYLRDIAAVPTTEGRSYFHPLTNQLAIGISAICFSTEDGLIHIREKDLIQLYGHEGMGHALNAVITKNSKLPYFLTKDTNLTSGTAESIAQHYQKVIFEDLKKSEATQEALGIRHSFGQIYQESKDSSKLSEYMQKLSQYATTVLADKELGKPDDPNTVKRKIEVIGEVALVPSYSRWVVEKNLQNFDSEGNLDIRTVSELMYCAKPVQRALAEFEKQGIKYEGENRSRIDNVLLTGFWTPEGYVENARVQAAKK
jgi:hypothetical protein